MPPINYLAVLVSTLVIFILGALWYSPLMFAGPWMRLQGKNPKDMKGGAPAAGMLVQAFLCGLVISFFMALLTGRLNSHYLVGALKLSIVCWAGFAGATSYATNLFSMRPRALWLIDSGYNLVCFMLSAIIIGAWK